MNRRWLDQPPRRGGGVLDGRKQYGQLGAEPHLRVLLVVERLRPGERSGWCEPDLVAVRLEEQGRAVRGVQVVVKDSAQGPVGVGLAGQLRGIGAQQVVHRVPARHRFEQEIRADDLGQHWFDIRPR
jgi:hypothetical protein